MRTLLNFFLHIFDRVCATRVTEAAAAIAYYAILSFFPLILFLIAFNSSFLQSAEVQSMRPSATKSAVPFFMRLMAISGVLTLPESTGHAIAVDIATVIEFFKSIRVIERI